MDLNLKYKQDLDIVSRQIAGEVILVPIRQKVGDLDSIYTLNETAAFTWSLLDGDTSLEQILVQITAEFDVEPGQAKKDLIKLIQEFEEIQAVIRV